MANESRLARIREQLHPTRPGYCAEPIDIEDARWLLAEVDRLRARWCFTEDAATDAGRSTLDAVGTTTGKVTTEKRG